MSLHFLHFFYVYLNSGLLGDFLARFGRRLTLVLCVVLTALSSIAGAFSPNYGTFASLRFVVAVFEYGLYAIPLVLSECFIPVLSGLFCYTPPPGGEEGLGPDTPLSQEPKIVAIQVHLKGLCEKLIKHFETGAQELCSSSGGGGRIPALNLG